MTPPPTPPPTIAFLGLGEMGSALARAAIAAGYPTVGWNRSPGKATPLQRLGATITASPADAVKRADAIVVCLFDHRSVHEVLDPLASTLSGRVLVNLTTTSPDAARELARWAATAGVHYLDGGIMAVPDMIGMPGTSVLYSGSAEVFEAHRPLLETWGRAEYFGADAGMASLYDLALLSAMYVMFAGFFHGAAMVGAAGVSAVEFAGHATPWLQAMAGELSGYAQIIDARDYARPGQQSLEFSDLTDIVDAAREQGVNTELVDVVQRFIRRQIDAGHGKHGFARMIESIRS